jgi:hypothetical protein
MTTLRRALTIAAAPALAGTLALIPTTAQAAGPAVTQVTGHATFNLPTRDRVTLHNVQGIFDDGRGEVTVRSTAGNLTGKVVCVTSSRVTPGFTDAAIGLHINRSTIAGIPRGTDAIEYIRSGRRGNPDASGLVLGTANCPASGFTIPAGVLVQVTRGGYNVRLEHSHRNWNRG